MTHDELLATVDEPNPIGIYMTQITTDLAKKTESYMITAFQTVGINPMVLIQQNALITQLKAQLRAVVELHKPWDGARMGGGGHNGPWCTHCEEVFDGSIRYPCPTIEAIQKELGNEDN